MNDKIKFQTWQHKDTESRVQAAMYQPGYEDGFSENGKPYIHGWRDGFKKNYTVNANTVIVSAKGFLMPFDNKMSAYFKEKYALIG